MNFLKWMFWIALLAPEIVHAALIGSLERSITLETLKKELPPRWKEQKKLFGIG